MENAKYKVTIRTIKEGVPEDPHQQIMKLSEIAQKWPALATAMALEPDRLSICFDEAWIDLDWHDLGRPPRAIKAVREKKALTKKASVLLNSLMKYLGDIAAKALGDILTGRITWGDIGDLTHVHNQAQETWEGYE